MSDSEGAEQVPVAPQAAAAVQDPPRRGDDDTRFFGQPWSLVHLFGVETWERFSFYGMQGILLSTCTTRSRRAGSASRRPRRPGIVGAYGGAVYLSTILGAWVADRLLGSERVLFFSAIVIMARAHRAGPAPRRRGRRRRPHPRRRRLRRPQGQRHVGRRHALLRRGHATRRRLLAVLPRHQPRRILRPDRSPDCCRPPWASTGASALAAIGMAIGLTQYAFGRKNLPDRIARRPEPAAGSAGTRSSIVIGVAAVVRHRRRWCFSGLIRADNLARRRHRRHASWRRSPTSS